MDKGQLVSAECGRLGITESWYRGIPTGERAIRLPSNGRKMSKKTGHGM